MFFIGVTLEGEVFKVAVLKKEKKSFHLESLHTFPCGPDNVYRNNLKNREFGKEAPQNFDSERVTIAERQGTSENRNFVVKPTSPKTDSSGCFDVKLFYNLPPFHTGKETQTISEITGSEIFVRKLHIPLREKRKILAALPFQLESLLPFPLESAVICAQLKPLGKKMNAVTLMATTKEALSSHVDALKELGITCDAISCTPVALMRLGRWKFPAENKVLAFDMRRGKLCCTVFEGKEIILCQTLSVDDAQHIPFELEKLSVFLKQKGAIDEDTPWMLVGEDTCAEEIAKVFTTRRLAFEESDLSAYGICIGLALDAGEGDAASVQLCQREFTPTQTLANRKKKALCYLACCLGAAIFMAVCSSWMLGKKHSAVANRLQSYLPTALSQGSFATPEQMQQKLYDWELSLKEKKTPFAIVPNVPKVSDVLAWISTHASFTNEDGSPKEDIEIQALHYRLTKYPKIGETSAPYTAQVDLEFRSKTPRAARDFHDSLLKTDPMVNTKKEVKWQTQNQTYHASFELNKGGSA